MTPDYVVPRKSSAIHKAEAGSGALGDLAAHLIDLGPLARRRAQPPSTGLLRTFITERPGGTVDVDDAFEATVEFENGAIGHRTRRRASRSGRKNQMRWEINGSKGTISLRRSSALNELEVNMGSSEPERAGRRASARCSSPRPTTRTGSTGGPTAT